MNEDKTAYCVYNEQGYCKICGGRKPAELAELGAWPTNTWFQNRRKLVALYELSKVQS